LNTIEILIGRIIPNRKTESGQFKLSGMSPEKNTTTTMIEKTTSFKTSDGTLHPTIEAAQAVELGKFLNEDANLEQVIAQAVAEKLIECSEHFIDILTMKATSKTRARKVNGGTKKRAAKATTTTETVPA